MCALRASLFAVLGAALLTLGVSPAPAEDPPPYQEHAAPLYLIISFDDAFVVSRPKPSQTIMVNIGTLVGGEGILDTRFLVDSALTAITLPDGRKAPSFEDLSDNSATLVGSFSTTDLGEIHMVTPAPGEIAPDIQVAVFQASNEGLLDQLLADDPYPTTLEVADVVMSRLPEGSTVTRNEVLSALFNSGQPLELAEFGATIVGEGEMFPHDSDAASLFKWSVAFDEDGTFSSDICMLIAIDVHPGSSVNPVNVGSKNGEVPIAVLTSGDFDATDVDVSTVHIGGVAPTKYQVRDVDGDGDDDIVFHWDVEDLVDGGAVSTSSTSITVTAELEDGTCIQGTDKITNVS